jgi:hypothetical protein
VEVVAVQVAMLVMEIHLLVAEVQVVLVHQIKLMVQMLLTLAVAVHLDNIHRVLVFKFRWEDLADLAAAVMEVGKVLHHQLTTQPTTQLLTRVAAVAAVKVMPLAVMVVLV